MASFTVRVELQDATWEQYNKFYERMAAEGFTDEIQSDNGTRYKMPDAEYNYVGSVSAETVREKAKRAASGVVNSFSVFVTESVRRVWVGLPVVK